MNLKHPALGLFALFLAHITIAQNLTQTVKGKIVDTQSKGPVVGANVIILGIEPIMGGVTNTEGEFKVTSVPIGRYNIQVTFIGYKDLIIPEVLVGSGKEVVLPIQLTESLINMEELVIRQEKGKPLNETATVSALSFSVEETSRYAATFDDPARAALSFAGVRGGGDDVLNEIVIRGNSPRGLLWRMEGIEIPNPNHFAEEGSSAGGISMLSSNVLSNSDFFTGAFPAAYGNALSGVFDLQLRNGNNESREYAVQAGLLGIGLAAEGPLGNSNKASYLANYRYSTLALFDNIGVDILGESEDITFQDLSFKIHMPTGKTGSLSLWGLGGISRQTVTPIQSDGEFIYEDFQTKLGVIGLSHILYINPDTYLETKVNFSASQNNYDEDSLQSQIYNKEQFINTALRGSVALNKKINARHNFKAGAIISRLGYDLFSEFWLRSERRFITELEQDGVENYFRSFAQWNFRPSEKITINSGLHYSLFLLNKHYEVEPRLGLRWDFTNRQSLSAGFGVHSRLEPLSLYLAQDEVSDATFIQPNKGLDFTKARHYVIGYQNQLKADLRLKTEFYYQDLYDVPIRPVTATQPWDQVFSSLNQSDGFITEKLVNEGTGENYGVELTLEKFFTNNYYFMITGSYFESKYRGADLILRDTRYNGNFISNFIFGKEFKVGLNGNNLVAINSRMIWAGNNRVIPIDLEQSQLQGQTIYEFDNAYSERLANYWRLDLGVSYRKNKPKHTSIIALNIQNITGKLNVGNHYYSSFSGQIRFEEQLGMFPNLSYQLEF